MITNTLLKPSQDAFDIIKQWESLRCRAYKALTSERYYTIGYGHCAADVKPNQVISPAKAESLLIEDVNVYAGWLACWNCTLTQRQYDALVSLIYNIGWYNFAHSMTGSTVAQLNTKTTPIAVARRMVLWVRAGGKVQLGLQRRRAFEANYFLGYEAFVIEDGHIYEHLI